MDVNLKTYTTAEAAAHYGIPRGTIQQAARRGQLVGTRRGSIWFFTAAQIEAWRRRTAQWREQRGKA
ncbi:MAG TPA: helix-turn-helix domain-containing protein [Herpetosiphonaceae bacterium]